MFCAASKSTVSLMRIEPRCGVAIPAMALMTLVLPEPERPKRPTMGASAANLTSRWKEPSCCSISTLIIALRLRGAAGEPLGRGERGDRQHDRDEAETHRLRVAARHLGETIYRQRQSLRLSGNVGDESNRGAEFAQPARERKQCPGDDPRQGERQR